MKMQSKTPKQQKMANLTFRFALILTATLSCTAVSGQMKHQIFPAEQGLVLEQSLVGRYKPGTVLDYSRARDTLFKRVYIERDSVVCVYTNHKIYLPPNADPTTAVYLNGIQNGINTEHSYPQSKGASEANGNPYSDMHHLYPTRLAVNEARGDKPFRDINDTQTQKWYFRDQTVTSAPATTTRDQYSEVNGTSFEVRESQKGNIARSVFYMYTMYRPEALAADPLFFEAQKSSLCAWHYADPVDSLEYARTYIIGKYQENKPNPFVLDCSLAARTYCGTVSGTCPIIPVSATDEPNKMMDAVVEIHQNTSHNTAELLVRLQSAQNVQITLYDSDGRTLRTLFSGEMGTEWTYTIQDLSTGYYYVSAQFANTQTITKPLYVVEK
jgi:endonuclease I